MRGAQSCRSALLTARLRTSPDTGGFSMTAYEALRQARRGTVRRDGHRIVYRQIIEAEKPEHMCRVLLYRLARYTESAPFFNHANGSEQFTIYTRVTPDATQNPFADCSPIVYRFDGGERPIPGWWLNFADD